MRTDPRVALAITVLVLALGSRASAGELEVGEEAASLLLAPELRSDQARASEASELLVAERRRKFADLSSEIVDLGIHASLQVSPLKLLRSVGRVGRGLRDWDDRSLVEDEALVLLGPGARSGDLDAASLALYARLERRESEARVAELLSEAERAFGAGDLRRTRRTVDRALELEPGSTRADRLLDEIDEQEWRATLDEQAEPEQDTSEFSIAAWEVQLGTALLLDDLARAQELGPIDSSDAALARAAARHLGGDRARAIDELRRVARGRDRAATLASEWLADPSMDPDAAFETELGLYRTRRALGWVGGEELATTAVPSATDALALTRDGFEAWRESYRAWRAVLTPVNLMIDAPARAWRSWQPEGRALGSAAQRYLELAPDGERASEAAWWIESLSAQERSRPRAAAFQDGVLVLPHSKTAWTRLSATRVVVARAALEGAAPELLDELSGDAAAFLISLDTESGRPVEAGSRLSTARSLALLAGLASGIESATLAARGESSSGVLGHLRRMDARVRAGRSLVARAWRGEQTSGADAFQAALVDGQRTRTLGAVELERREENLVAERALGAESLSCPPETPCIEPRRDYDPMFYANGDADGELGVGARASLDHARVAIEVGTFGPRASLVIPFARWLGISRYFPVEARLAVGLDGISAVPHRSADASVVPDPSF